jgi:hypothetical protein
MLQNNYEFWRPNDDVSSGMVTFICEPHSTLYEFLAERKGPLQVQFCIERMYKET